MRRQKLQDSELDKLGTRLIAAGRFTETEAERVASAPYLFSRIRAEINAAPAVATPELNLGRITALVSGALALAVVAVSIAMLARSEDPAIASRKIQSPPLRVSAPAASSTQSDMVTDVQTAEAQILPERRPQTALLRRTRKDPVAAQRASQDTKPPIEFLPINFAGDPAEMSRGRVIRVEMPRASLFAMGINVPIENVSDVITADLLVGADGVTRAVRIVN